MLENTNVNSSVQTEIDTSREMPTVDAVQQVLDGFAAPDSLQDTIISILTTVTEQLPEIDAVLSRWRGQIAIAQIAEPRATVRADFGAVDNRISTALQHMREIQTRAIDLANIVSALSRERTDVVTRAVERGYAAPAELAVSATGTSEVPVTPSSS